MSGLSHALRITADPSYRTVMLSAADSVARLFNPRVGTMLSWPGMVSRMSWPHNTIIDNMMNLELLFWAARNGGSPSLREMAVTHARTTARHHFRPDFTCYHVAVYDTVSGQFIKGVTHQGWRDDSMWARGQAWAIYGYTIAYRETGLKEFLDMAIRTTKAYTDRLPDDLVPYWDFTAADSLPSQPRDASAAAIVASALIELSTLASDPSYIKLATDMLASLSDHYTAKGINNAMLLHSTGHKPNGSEVDASIIYADYYYVEALAKLAHTIKTN